MQVAIILFGFRVRTLTMSCFSLPFYSWLCVYSCPTIRPTLLFSTQFVEAFFCKFGKIASAALHNWPTRRLMDNGSKDRASSVGEMLISPSFSSNADCRIGSLMSCQTLAGKRITIKDSAACDYPIYAFHEEQTTLRSIAHFCHKNT